MPENEPAPVAAKTLAQTDRFASLLEQQPKQKSRVEMAKEAAVTIDIVTHDIIEMLEPFPHEVRRSMMREIATALQVHPVSTDNTLREVALVGNIISGTDTDNIAHIDTVHDSSHTREERLYERVNTLMDRGEGVMVALTAFLNRFNSMQVMDDEEFDLMAKEAMAPPDGQQVLGADLRGPAARCGSADIEKRNLCAQKAKGDKK